MDAGPPPTLPALPPPTHKPADHGVVMALLRAVMGKAAPDGAVSPAALAEVAAQAEAPLELAYVALAMHPGLRLLRAHPVAFGVCTGRCQLWGSHDLLADLLRRAAERAGQGKAGFDVVPQGCLNLCDHPPAVVAAAPDGVAGLPRCTAADLDEAIAALVDAGP